MAVSSTSSTMTEFISRGDYSKLGRFMGTWNEMAAFRKFGDLNAQNLLYLQAELVHLEVDLKELQKTNSQDEKSRDLWQNWQDLSTQENGEHNRQYQKVLEIRKKLAEYNEALLQYHALCKLHKPTAQNLRCLRRWLDHDNGGDCFLHGFELKSYDGAETMKEKLQQERDLVTMSDDIHQRDLFSRWLGEHFIKWYDIWVSPCFKGSKAKEADIEEAGLSHYKDTRLNAISHFVGNMVASLLPAISILALYFIHNMLARLGAIMAFSALFSFTLAIFTTAKRIEIFAATAAYVLILSFVFILSSYWIATGAIG